MSAHVRIKDETKDRLREYCGNIRTMKGVASKAIDEYIDKQTDEEKAEVDKT